MKHLLPLVLLAALCAAGCATSGRQIDPNAVAKIQKGVTTRAQVIALMGEPQAVSNNGNGIEVLTYMYVHAQANGASYIPIAGAFVGGVDSHSQHVTVLLSNGVVKEVRTSSGTDTLRRGN